DTSVATTAFVRSILGYFGVGQAGEPSETDMNKYTTPGNYITPQGGLTNLPPGWSSNTRYSLVVDGFGATRYLVQTITTGLAQGVDIDQAQRTMSAAGVWSPWRSVWNGNNTPKQTSPTDLTAGAMLETGSFGLGKAIVSAEPDLDKYTVPGNYLTPIVDLLNLPPGWNQTHRYSVVVEGYTGNNYLIQRITGGLASGHTPIFAVRVMQGAASWTPWQVSTTSETLPFRGTVVIKTVGVTAWQVPPFVKKVWVTVIGGGGGGGCSMVANNIGSGGGGGGGVSQRLVNLTDVASVSVTVGVGGLGASVAGSAGGAGGTSSFGAYHSATGGAGGGGNSPVGNAPGSGGRGSGGDHNTSLGPGAPNYSIHGGTGGGPGPRSTQAAVPGSDALDAGGGGSGAQPGQPGGNGAAGCVIIQW
ncbi:glycine-rich domain-containing protein, partial [Pseudomonas putida]|uniref:glycine-rich domain-containing protein n=1 Tax=Pseudomonas putida TaxID=303 RepID=UPI0039DFD34F